MLTAVLLLGLLLVGCGHGKDSSTVAQYYGNYHQQGWIATHGGQAVAGVDACTRCHEISVLKVGSGVPTCMTTGCHHQTVADWAGPAVHGLRAKLAAQASGGSLVSCQICHGKDFSGGPSANACVTCHGVKAPHPHQPWRIGSGSTLTHATTDPSNAAVCAQCHYPGSPNNPAGHPATPAPAGTQPGCYNATLCHDANTMPHPVPFLAGQVDAKGNGHLTASAAAFASDCGSCHAYSGTSPSSAAPLCNKCHALADPTAPGTSVGTCLSCHAGAAGLPKGPGGTIFPSISGAHAKHMNLATSLTCNSCHAGSGTGTATHYANANARVSVPTGPAAVAIDAIFKTKTGGNPAFVPSSLTCSNVSCHGGQTAPSWQTGSISASTQCTACHGVAASAGTAVQFNDAFGRHSQGSHNATTAANNIACTTCHNMANGSAGALAHFKYLDTPAVDSVASGAPADQVSSGTIVFDSNIVTAAGPYAVTASTQGNGSCALTCHSHVHVAAYDTWTASGAPHPKPFLAGQVDAQGNGHFTITAAAFGTDCATCHAYSGASPMATAPLCNACHTLADPTLGASGAGTCLSCHAGAAGLTKGPGGTGFPSIPGAHAKHMNLATPLSCDTCHAGSGTGTGNHYTNANRLTGTPTAPAPVSMDATYSAKTGSPTFNPATTAFTCSNVSCHGAQTTPNWQSGTINSATQCSACHGVTTSGAQYNDAFGRHTQGSHNATTAANNITCTTCHNMVNGSPGALAHFKYLNTTAVDGTAAGVPVDQLSSSTIVFDTTIVSGPGTYTVNAAGTKQGDGGCALTCHTHLHGLPYDTWLATGASHPKPFLAGQVDSQGKGHFTINAADFATDCATCHAYSGSSPMATAPLCNACHTLADPTLGASAAGTCLSCHAGAAGLPKGPGGTGFPSIAGAHAKHMNLATTLSCDTCHADSGTGTGNHYTNANRLTGTPTAPASVSMDATYSAKTGSPTFNPATTAFTCSNVSCHGGQTAPNWQSGTINSNAQCSACHAVATSANQYNDAFGRHALGTHNATTATNNIACTTCHNMANGSVGALAHFKYLNTTAVDGTTTGVPVDQMPSTTILFDPAIISGARTYTVNAAGTKQGDGGCALTCHTHLHVETVNTWASPVPHPVPFLTGMTDSNGNGHLNVTAAKFVSDCATCHAYSGTAPLSAAPLCNACHQLADPTQSASGVGTCLSCHAGTSGLPSGPGGTIFPSIAGAHAKHMGLATTLNCDTCHAGTGAGTTAHYTNANYRSGTPVGPAPVSISATFQAKTGGAPTFVPTNLTCSSVSCHGGQAAPNWQSGTINTNTQCTACHGATTLGTQYNDAFGRHTLGTHNSTTAANNIACTTCHNMANGSPGALAHFKYLNTTAVDGTSGTPTDQLPSGTIVFDATVVSGVRTYTVNVAGTRQGDGGCALTCHTHIHSLPYDTWLATGASHPKPFLAGQTDSQGKGHFTINATDFATDCATCHAYSGSSPVATAPLCNACHTLADPSLSATGAATCLSCHAGTAGLPKGPGGTGFPSIAGAHLKHMNLATPLSCDTCHAGTGTGTTSHYTNANRLTGTPSAPASVSMDAAYSAKTGSPAFNPATTAFTCSNVSCHGGQTTPNWQSGAINSNTQCSACHGVAASAGTTVQYNDAFGRHTLGTHNATTAANSITCTTCHNMANGSPGALAHFKYLNTTAVDGTATGVPVDQLPSGTILFDSAIVSGPGTYAVTSATQGDGGCALTCHTYIHTNTVNTWKAAAPSHPIPFKKSNTDAKGNGHLTVTATAFASDCATCHAYSGVSPTPSAPLCNLCHQVADPTGATTGIGTCLSCHVGTSGLPTGPNGGATFPSIAGAHLKHMNLPTALTCDTCHAGAGAGTDTHYLNANYRSGNPTGPATVAILATFQAKTGGVPSFNASALSCSSVSCHGGQSTPSWQTGTIDSTTQCTVCHGVAASSATVTQFNDAFGRHSQGSHDATNGTNAIACTTCHNMTPGSSQGASNHFKYLDTTAVDGTSGAPTDQLPSGTVVFDPAIVTAAGPYAVTATTQGNGSCALTCHTHIHTATYDTWTAAGATHPVPFYAGQLDGQNNGHMTVTASIFAADCGTCHSYSGTSPLANAPKCSTCHLLGDPTSVVTGAGTCLSCHVGSAFSTSGPAGGTFPSINGAHTKHLTLPTTLTCDACHASAGTGTTIHYDNANYRTGTPTGPAPVAIAAAFTAQHGGAPAFTAADLTCSNVSCHGGQTTPGWRTAGSIVSSTDCRKCHAINDGSTATPTQFNDAVGRHAWGTHNAAGTSDCTLCHDMSSGNAANGAIKHFAELDTTAVSSTNKYPSGTIRFKTSSTSYQISGTPTYTIDGTHPETDGGCALTCHTLPSGSTQTHEPVVYHWQAAKGSGIAHAVPFISTAASNAGNYHHLVTAATFTSDCSSCHDISGSTTKGGPTCMTCHTLADPTLSATGAGTCLSCHIGANFATKGPQGAANVWPNLPGAHAKHVSLLSFTRTSPFAPTSASAYPVCEACHVGTAPLDSLQTHYTNANKRPGAGGATTAPAPVFIDAKFNAQSGAATPNTSPSSFTCSNVSCHGGQVTPGWQSGTIPVNATTYCASCHKTASTATQYNDATGRHQSVTAHRQTCNYCHDLTQNKTGALNHFKYLDTSTVSGVTGTPSDQFPSDTIKFLSGSTTTGVSIDAGASYVVSGTGNNNGNQGRGGCALTCHTPSASKAHLSNNEYWN